jgi:hypothetical protein
MEKHRDRQKKYRLMPERKEKIKNTTAIYHLSPRYRFLLYRNDAKNHGREFNLTFEQFMDLWQKQCRYCGDSIKTVGIDRKNNLIGYTVENSVSCCATCNRMKLNHSEEYFLSQCERITNHGHLGRGPHP